MTTRAERFGTRHTGTRQSRILTAPRAGRPDTAPAFAAALAEVPGTA